MGLMRDRWTAVMLPYKLWDRDIQAALGSPDSIMSIEVDQDLHTFTMGVWDENVDMASFFQRIDKPFSICLELHDIMGVKFKAIIFNGVKYHTHTLYEDQFSGVMYPEITFGYEGYERRYYGINN